MSRRRASVGLNVILLGITSLLTDTSSEIAMPILPIFISMLAPAGMAAMAVGLVGGLGDSVANLLKVPSGYWSDRIGRRKPLVALGYFSSAVAKLFMPLATAWHHLLVLRPLERVGKGIRTAPRDALVAESAPQEVRGKAFGIHRAMDTTGAIAGSATALLLVLAGIGIREILIISAAIAFIALIPIYFVRDVRSKPKETGLIAGFGQLSKPFKKYILITAIFALSDFTYMLFILKAREALTGVVQGVWVNAIPILLYVLFNVSYAALSVPSGTLSDRIGRRRVLVMGYLVYAATCLGFSAWQAIPLMALLFLLYGVSKALVDGTQRAYASDLAPPELKGTALGTFHTTTGFATLFAGVVAGALWTGLGASATFLYGFALALASALLMAAFTEGEK